MSCNCNNGNKTSNVITAKIGKPAEAYKDPYANRDASNVREFVDKWQEVLGFQPKEEGKGLSEENYTSAEKQKLAELENYNDADLREEIATKVETSDFETFKTENTENLNSKLPRGTYEGTASDLKTAIDTINAVLNSDDTTLDELQEIVTFIKQNKQILDTLGISNIAGLEEALSNKVNIEAGKSLSSNDFTNELKEKVEKSALVDASNIDNENVNKWIERLRLTPSNHLNVLSNSLLPMLSANHWGKAPDGSVTNTGVGYISKDSSGTYVRYIRKGFAFFSLYGLKIPEYARKVNLVKSVDVRHTHTEPITIWDTEVLPNTWKRISTPVSKNDQYFGVYVIIPETAEIHLRKAKIENNSEATPWMPHITELFNSNYNTLKLGYNDLTKGNSGNSRALAKEKSTDGPKLVLNYANDFSGGTEVQGKLEVGGELVLNKELNNWQFNKLTDDIGNGLGMDTDSDLYDFHKSGYYVLRAGTEYVPAEFAGNWTYMFQLTQDAGPKNKLSMRFMWDGNNKTPIYISKLKNNSSSGWMKILTDRDLNFNSLKQMLTGLTPQQKQEIKQLLDI